MFWEVATRDGNPPYRCRWIYIRQRSRWEVQTYLERKKTSPGLVEDILNKLSNLNLIDDEKFAKAYVEERQLLRPASRRKIIMDLRKKHVGNDAVQSVIGADNSNDQTALQEIITHKRKQTRYQDDLKLMQYLARQGFSYGDIKVAMQEH